MLNKLLAFLRQHRMLQKGERLICAVSGGADSVGLLFALYLLKDKLEITLEAAHFNHGLRGEEADRDERFVKDLCERYSIPLHIGRGEVKPGKKGLEAAARGARYAFLESLGAKVATAHTADDNTETVLMHLIRGTGLKGLGGITPVRGCLIRPMLCVTREEILAFLGEYHLRWIDDSSNATDLFLRNRLRHHVIPLLLKENPRLAENVSVMALRLRDDDAALNALMKDGMPGVSELRSLPAAVRKRYISRFLVDCGVPEPEAQHICLVERLIFSDKPSAAAYLPEGIQVRRCYDRLSLEAMTVRLEPMKLTVPSTVDFPSAGVRLHVRPATTLRNDRDHFTVQPQGQLWVRGRLPGDTIRLPGGRKELKKLFIDRKIPAGIRPGIPVLADDSGILGAWMLGANADRLASGLPAVEISFERYNTHGGHAHDDTDKRGFVNGGTDSE